MESSSVTEWLSSIDDTLLVNVPSLGEVIVTVAELNVSVMRITSSVNFEALTSIVLDVSSGTVVPSDLIVGLTLVWSHGSSNTNSESVTQLIGKDSSS